jgi:ribosomal protein S18 acetylase RimI-like enzyme
MIVREATLDDVQDIVSVYLTNPDRPFDQPVEQLSIAERYSYGGPWMSVEPCAIHVNNMLAWGCTPLVVEEGSRVIAETEFYIGPDVPPLGRTLDISVLYVHTEWQRRGAGSLLMEAMIDRARGAGCDQITVNTGTGSQGFYRRFGFGHALDLQVIQFSVAALNGHSACEPCAPRAFEAQPEGTLWIGRFLSPAQKWREIVDQIERRDAILPRDAGRPAAIGISSTGKGFTGFLIPGWGNPARAQVYCWAKRPTREMVSSLLAEARHAGYSEAHLLCHAEVTEMVADVCGAEPAEMWPVWARKL